MQRYDGWFTLMGHCGMSLQEVQQKFTYRQYEAFLAWKEAKLNDPDLTQMYLMQLARLIHLQNASDADWQTTKISDYKLRFGEQPVEELTPEEEQMHIEMVKGAWGARVGGISAPMPDNCSTTWGGF